jgi:hypothetical protein
MSLAALPSVGLRDRLVAVEQRKILRCRESKPGGPAHSPPLCPLSCPDFCIGGYANLIAYVIPRLLAASRMLSFCSLYHVTLLIISMNTRLR